MNEIGIRIALGAGRRTILRMVLGESLLVVAIGVVIGLGIVFAAGNLVTTILYGLDPTDPATMAVAATVIVLGTVVRLVLGFGGAALVFLASGPTFRSDPVSYWLWVLSAYLVTLVVETSLLSSDRRVYPGGS